MSRRIRPDRVVTLAYELRDEQGNELEIRTPESPLVFLQGRGQLLTAVEKALEGQTPGFARTIRLDPRDAYGPYRPELVAEMPLAAFPKGREIAAGMKFDTAGPDGRPIVVRVVEVGGKTVTLDGNHPLAGVSLVFEVRVLDVREASEDELKTGIAVPPGRSGLH